MCVGMTSAYKSARVKKFAFLVAWCRLTDYSDEQITAAARVFDYLNYAQV